MNVALCIAVVLSLLVIWETVAGAAFFPRAFSIMDPVMDRGLQSFSPELFVYAEEHPVAFRVIIVLHSVVVALFWWQVWWHWG